MNARSLPVLFALLTGCGFVSVVDASLDGGASAGGAASGGSASAGGSANAGGSASAGGSATAGGASGGGSAGGSAGGAACTPQSERNAWPVKFVFVVQNSGVMCAVDPPGSTGTSGFCDAFVTPGVTSPARVRAIRSLLAAHQGHSNVSAALVSFGLTPTVVPFTTPAMLDSSVASLQSNLVSGTNLQAALVATKTLLDTDIANTPPALRGHTRYLVVLLSTGVPFPRCAANDMLPIYANAGMPSGTWADSSTQYCNGDPMSPEPLGPFVPGSDLNQNTQLRQAAAAIAALKRVHGLGDVQFHARVVMSAATLQACGPQCLDAFGGLTASEARAVGGYTLNELVLYAGGTFADPGEPANLGTSLANVDTRELTTFCSP